MCSANSLSVPGKNSSKNCFVLCGTVIIGLCVGLSFCFVSLLGCVGSSLLGFDTFPSKAVQQIVMIDKKWKLNDILGYFFCKVVGLNVVNKSFEHD